MAEETKGPESGAEASAGVDPAAMALALGGPRRGTRYGQKIKTSGSGAPPPVAAYSFFVVVVLLAVYSLNYLDRQILSILSEPIRKEFDLSYTQIGLLTGFSFALFYSLFGMPLAWFADRIHRVRLIAASLAAWSVCTMTSGMAINFATLALARIGVGIGEAGGSPGSYSLISDYFPPQKRGLALAIYSMGVPIGMTLGAALGAGIAAHYGWRTAFYALGLPGILVAALILILIREPRRGTTDEAGAEGVSHAAALTLSGAIAAFCANPTLVLTGLAAGLSNFVTLSVLNNAPAFLMSNKHMSLNEIATFYSMSSFVGGITGSLASGWLADWLARRHCPAYALIPAVGFTISIPVLIAFLDAPTWQIATGYFAIYFALLSLWLPAVTTIFQNAVPANQRATAGAFQIFLANFIGLGGGPLYVGIVADHFKPIYGTGALKFGLMALVPITLMAIVALFIASRFIMRDTNIAVRLASAKLPAV